MVLLCSAAGTDVIVAVTVAVPHTPFGKQCDVNVSVCQSECAGMGFGGGGGVLSCMCVIANRGSVILLKEGCLWGEKRCLDVHVRACVRKSI